MSLTATQDMWIEKMMFAFICIATFVAVWQVFGK